VHAAAREAGASKEVNRFEERGNAVPSGVLVFPLQEEITNILRLPLKVEQHVADDLTFLATV